MPLHQARLYAILDTSYVEPHQWKATAKALLEGGADIIQLRAKNETHSRRRVLLEAILPYFDGLEVPLIVNDDLELALAYPNIGLHVGQSDVPPKKAREQLGPKRLLGLSTHSIDQAQIAANLAETLDYFAIGPLFATPTKPDYPSVGLTVAQRVSKLKTQLPIFGIGGINPTTVSEVLATGIKRVVAVSALLCANDIAKATYHLKRYLS